MAWLNNPELASMPSVVIPDDAPAVLTLSSAYRRLTEGLKTRAYTSRPASVTDLIERIGDADFVINVRARTPFNRQVLKSCPKLRLISIWGTGTDNVDLAAARELGI